MNAPARPAINPNILDVMSNWLFTDPVPGGSKRPNLRIKVLGNVPRLTVKTNVEGDQTKNNGKIDFNTDLATWSIFVEKVLAMAEGRDTSEGYNFHYMDDFLAGKKLDRPIIISTLQVGRDANGRLYMAILSGDKSRPRIQFFFGPTKYHDMTRRDGSPLTPREISDAFAIGFLKPMAGIVLELLNSEFNPDAKNVAKAPGAGGYNNGGQGGGQGGYNNNRGGQGGGGYNNNRPAPVPTTNDAVDFDEFLM